MTDYTHNILSRFPLISDQISKEGMYTILKQLEHVLKQEQGIQGDIVEFGCYIGTTSLFIRRMLDAYGQSGKRAFHAYDSFEGLPPKDQHDQSAAGIDFKPGELSVSKKQFIHEFQRARLSPPVTHKGWFDELTENDVPEHIAFAFLDGDFYGSIICSLRLVWPRMSQGGVILVDDYKREALPGVDQAIRDFLQGKSVRSLRAEHNTAIIEV